MNLDVKNVVKKLSKIEESLKENLESGALFKEFKRFAGGKAQIFRKKMKTSSDVRSLVNFIEKRKKEIEKLTKEFPKEVSLVKTLIKTQRKELQKIGDEILGEVRTSGLNRRTLKSAMGKVKSLGKPVKSKAKAKKAKTVKKVSRKK